MKSLGGHFAPKLGGHFELESGGHFKLELGGQYHWNLHPDHRIDDKNCNYFLTKWFHLVSLFWKNALFHSPLLKYK
jgi:hypothetical protein